MVQMPKYLKCPFKCLQTLTEHLATLPEPFRPFSRGHLAHISLEIAETNRAQSGSKKRFSLIICSTSLKKFFFIGDAVSFSTNGKFTQMSLPITSIERKVTNLSKTTICPEQAQLPCLASIVRPNIFSEQRPYH